MAVIFKPFKYKYVIEQLGSLFQAKWFGREFNRLFWDIQENLKQNFKNPVTKLHILAIFVNS